MLAFAKISSNPSRETVIARTLSWYFFVAQPHLYIIHRKLVFIHDILLKLKSPPNLKLPSQTRGPYVLQRSHDAESQLGTWQYEVLQCQDQLGITIWTNFETPISKMRYTKTKGNWSNSLRQRFLNNVYLTWHGRLYGHVTWTVYTKTKF